MAGRVPARAAREGAGPGLERCQWATGDSSFCRRRRRSSAASGSPSSDSSSVPTDSGAGGREVRSATQRNPLPAPRRPTTLPGGFSGSGAGGEAPGDGVVASELGMLVEEAAAATGGAVSSVALTEGAGRGGLGRKRDKR